MTGKRFYNLDGLRFFAALFVVLGHTEMIKKDFNLPSLYHYSFFINAGPLAVTFFFVLSGFLITYLLILEQTKRVAQGKKINLLQFYKNRIFRIWPLYYTLVLLIFLAFPYMPLLHYPGYGNNFISEQLRAFTLYLSFCPNLSNYVYGNVLYLGQIWSLGVEEFFYLFFPLGIYLLSFKQNLKYFVILTFGSVAITAISKIWCSAGEADLSIVCIYISRYRIYAFALGALAAYGFIHMNNCNSILKYSKYLKPIGYTLLFVTVALLLRGVTFSSLTHPVYALIFAMLIFFITVLNIKISLLNHPLIVYLGKISYGIYMLHPLAIVICIKLFYLNTKNDFLNVLAFGITSVTATIILSIISYTFLEKPFLKMRKLSTLTQSAVSF